VRDIAEMRFVTVVTLIVLSILAGCDHGLNKPVTTREVIYAGAWHILETPERFCIYVYGADSLTLLDSLLVAGFPDQVVTSRDSRYLYVLQGASPPLIKLDAMTGSEVWAVEDAAYPLLLLDRGRMLVSGHTILDPETGALLHNLPDSLEPGYGSELGTEVAAIVDNEGTILDTVVTVLDCATGATRGRFVPYAEDYQLNAVSYVRLHTDGERVFAIGTRFALEDSWVVIGNVKTGETLYYHSLTRPFGEVAISPNDSLAAVMDPPTMLALEGGGPALLLALQPSPHTLSVEYGGGQARFTADGSRIIVGAAPGLPGALARVDVASLSLIDWVAFPGADSLGLNGPFGAGMDLGMRECPKH